MSPQRTSATSGGRSRPPGRSGRNGRGGTRNGRGGTRNGRGGRDRNRRPLLRRVLTGLGLAALAVLLLGAAAFVVGYVSTDIPDPNKDFTAQTTFVYYSDGKSEVGRFATQNRTRVALSDVPQQVRDAVIAAEDRTFYTNKGVDPKGILRAAFSNVRGNPTQGASTITQQYVKIFYLSQERTLTRKVKEAFVSLKLQRRQSKDEILQGYLNTIYFGRGAYGVQAASRAYFDKDVSGLDAAQGAVLAAVLNSPTALDPAGGPDARRALLGRYRYILGGMAEEGSISADRAATLRTRLPRFPKVERQDQYGGQRGHILALVKRQLLARGFSDQEISGGGLKVTTTFTRNAMDAAAKAVRDQAPRKLRKLHVAVASVDPQTGALRGMYAGQDYLDSQINWALAGSSPGSAFKPFALAAGLADGYSLRSTFAGNSPYVFPNGTSRVVNEGPGDGNDYGSAISLLTATEQSVNTAYIDLTQSMREGPRKILDMAVRMGVPRTSAGLEPVAGISLGSATISPVDMASGYATIADGGRARKWYAIAKVTDDSGRTRYSAPKGSRRALREDLTRDVSYALQQVVQDGTGRNALALDRPAAGKTGTATNEAGNVSSSWFVGYTPQMATAVMYVRGDGNDNLNCVKPRSRGCDPGYLVPYFGAEFPTRTWTDAMRGTLDDIPVADFPPPANVPAERDDHPPAPTFAPVPSSAPVPAPVPTRQPRPAPPDRPAPTRSSGPTPSAPPPSAPPPSPSSPPSTPPAPPPSSPAPPATPPPTPPPAPGDGTGNGTGTGNGAGSGTGSGTGSGSGNGAADGNGRGTGVAAP